jgi:hypothetical protein
MTEERRISKMKKTMKIIAVAMVAVMLCLCFASCAKTVSGKYKGEIDVLLASYEVVYEFKGSNVTVTRQLKSAFGNADPVVVEGTYEITTNEDETMTLTITIESTEEDAEDYAGKHSFVEGKEGDAEYIKIDGVKFVKEAK